MMSKKKIIVVVVGFIAFSLLFLLQELVSAKSVGDDFPPRPTVEPTTVPATPQASQTIEGATIKLKNLRVEPIDELWTVVQWYDGEVWHDVEGWRGTFNGNGEVSWWVYSSDLGKGPFRWVIYQDELINFTSDSFYLPNRNGETLLIQVPSENKAGSSDVEVHASQPRSLNYEQLLSNQSITMSKAHQVSGANGFIILQNSGQSIPDVLWTQIEWQDNEGQWHSVDGWGGQFDHTGKVLWWVSPEHAGTGPFRWVIFESQENKENPLEISPPFLLPSQYENIQIDLIID